MGSIVLLSGPIGAGKTTVAQELVALSSGSIVYIEGDEFWFFIVKSGEGQSRHKNFRTIMAAMVAAAIPYAMAGYQVIVDFSVPPWFLETARKIVQKREIPLHFVVLRPGLDVCAARAAGRAEGTIPDYTGYAELYADFESAETYTVKNDSVDPKTAAALVREGLDAGRFRV